MHALIALAVFSAGLLAGMRLAPETFLGSSAVGDPASNGKPGVRSAKSSQRNHEGREVGTLSRIERLLWKPLSAGLIASSSELSEEQLTELITPDEVPDLLAALLQKAGVMGVIKLPHSNYISKGEQDAVILRDLVRYYYNSSPDEAIEWIKGLSTDHDRKLMARMLINDLNNQTLSSDHRMTLPTDFHSQWEKSDAEGARAWRRENPDWSPQE